MAQGAKTGGRSKGTPNRTTAVLKEVIILAAEEIGEDGAGKDGLKGYLKYIAINDIKAFSALIGKIIPTQVDTTLSGSLDISTKEQRDAAVAAAALANS